MFVKSLFSKFKIFIVTLAVLSPQSDLEKRNDINKCASEESLIKKYLSVHHYSLSLWEICRIPRILLYLHQGPISPSVFQGCIYMRTVSDTYKVIITCFPLNCNTTASWQPPNLCCPAARGLYTPSKWRIAFHHYISNKLTRSACMLMLHTVSFKRCGGRQRDSLAVEMNGEQRLGCWMRIKWSC